MTAGAIAAEAVDDVGRSPLLDGGPHRGDGEEEELPVARRGAEALLALHHRLLRNELDDRADRVPAAFGGVGDGERLVEVAEPVVDVEAPNLRHRVQVAEVADLRHEVLAGLRRGGTVRGIAATTRAERHG